MYILRYRTAALFLDPQGRPTRCKELAREFASVKAALAWCSRHFRDPIDASCWMPIIINRGLNDAS